MEIMKIEKAEKLKVHQSFAEKLHPMPPNIWKPELTPEQKAQYDDDLAKGVVPF